MNYLQQIVEVSIFANLIPVFATNKTVPSKALIQ